MEKALKFTTINTLGGIFNKASRYLIVIVLIKVLKTTGYGYYTIGLTVISIGLIFAKVGLHYGVFRFIPIYIGQNNIGKIKGVISFSLKFVAISSIAISLLLFYSSEFIAVVLFKKPDLIRYIKLFSLTIPITALSGIVINVFKGFGVIKLKVFIEDLIVNISKIILFALCLYFGFGANGIVLSYLISAFLGLIIGIYFLLKLFPDLKSKNIKSEVNKNEILAYSGPLFISSFLAIILNRIDILMLSFYLPADQVGIYSIANRLAVLVFFIASSTFAIFSPTIAKYFGVKDRGEIQRLLNYFTRGVLIATIPIFLIITIFNKDVLAVFGEECVTGSPALVILASSFLINSIFGFAGQVLGVVGRSKLILINSIGASILNIVLNVVLIKRYGIVGAAFATGFSIVVVNIARVIEIFFLEHYSVIKTFLALPILTGAITGSIILLIKNLMNYQISLQYFIVFAIGCLMLYATLTWMIVCSQEERNSVYNKLFIKV